MKTMMTPLSTTHTAVKTISTEREREPLTDKQKATNQNNNFWENEALRCDAMPSSIAHNMKF
jgi:hypothetical protein